MSSKHIYIPKGVCSSKIEIETEENIIKNIEVLGGCNGNLKAITALTRDKDIDETISLLEGIKCGFKTTSCPDQIAQALKEIKSKKESI